MAAGPGTARLNGMVELPHRVAEQEFYQRLDKDGSSDDIRLFNDKLREMGGLLQCHRSHGASMSEPPTSGSRQRKSRPGVTEGLRPGSSASLRLRPRPCP
jgi:hypothetical protein